MIRLRISFNNNTKRIADSIDVKVNDYFESKVYHQVNNSSTNPINNAKKVDEPLLDEENVVPLSL